MGHLTHTVGGNSNLVSFRTPARVPVESLKCHFTPIQNGSGDPSPNNVRPITGWTGIEAYKRGKNIWDEEWENGVYATSTGNPVDIAEYLTRIRSKSTSYIPCSPYTEYYFNTNGHTMEVYQYRSDKSYISKFNAKDAKFRVDAECRYLRFNMASTYGNTYKKDISVNYPSTVTSYEPYQGETIPVTFPVLGKNKLPNDFSAWSLSRNYLYISGLVKEGELARFTFVDKDTSVDITGCYIGFQTGVTQTTLSTGYRWVIENGTVYTDCSNVSNGGTKGIRCDGVFIYPRTEEMFNKLFSRYDIMVELGSEATAYEPYDPNNTVYGGYVDLAAGEVVAEWYTITFDETTPMRAYVSDYRNLGLSCNASYWLDSLNAPKARTYIPYSVDGYCDKLPYLENNYAHTDRASASNTTFEVGLAGTRTEEEYLEWISENGPITITYKMQTPIHYPLTPTQIQTLLDRNNFYSNTNGNTEVSYAVHDTAPIRAAKKRIAANEPHIVTPTSAGLVSFSTDMIAPLKECKVGFLPVQNGSGDPSPTNARPISGWSGITIGNQSFSPGPYTAYTSNDGTYCDIKTGQTFKFEGTSEGLVLLNIYREDDSGIKSIRPMKSTNGVQWDTYTATEDIARFIFVNSLVTNGYVYMLNNITEIDWQTSAGTIYGGYVDLVRGEVVAEWKYVTIDEKYYTYISGDQYRGTNCTNVWFDMGSNKWDYNVSYVTSNINGDVTKCESFKLISMPIWNNPDLYPWHYVLNNINQVHCVFDNTTVGITSEDTNAEAITKIKAWVHDHPIKIAYRLAKAKQVSYPLTSAQIKTLHGVNNIWSNTNGTIDLSYWSH